MNPGPGLKKGILLRCTSTHHFKLDLICADTVELFRDIVQKEFESFSGKITYITDSLAKKTERNQRIKF